MHALLATTPPLTDQAEDLTGLWNTFVILAAIIGTLVAGLIAFVVIRYRRRDDRLPSQQQYANRIEAVYTIVPLLIVIALFTLTVRLIVKVDDTERNADLTVDVTAYQWQWQFDYPESDARSTGTGTKRPVLALPADSTVRFRLRSRDVVHSFWIPGFQFKRDVIPGSDTEFIVDVGDKVGNYPDSGVCAEFCGLDHVLMRFDIRVLPRAEFDRWLAAHPAKEAS